ncbi:MAG: PilZ domain-containing protein [Desulfobacter sp.]|nr:MAG: PilZ domain-containing protein [Desulfobacter sp.]
MGMAFNAEKIFLPSVGVDLVFNMDTDTPISRASIIYDADYKNKTITIAQPNPALTPNTAFDQLHLTTIVHTGQRRTRIGINCLPVKFIENYPLANRTTTRALILQYTLPASETNIRSAFRLAVSTSHTVKGKLLYNQKDFFTVKDFRVKDISFTGLGIVVPKKRGKAVPVLAGLRVGTLLPMGISLVDNKKETPLATFPLKVKVVRVNQNYSETHILIGMRIQGITPENEELLIKFIHEAQIAELKRISQKG